MLCMNMAFCIIISFKSFSCSLNICNLPQFWPDIVLFVSSLKGAQKEGAAEFHYEISFAQPIKTVLKRLIDLFDAAYYKCG